MVYSGPKSMFAKAAFLLLDDERDRHSHRE